MLQSAFCDFLVTVPQRTVVCVAIAADHSVVTVIAMICSWIKKPMSRGDVKITTPGEPIRDRNGKRRCARWWW